MRQLKPREGKHFYVCLIHGAGFGASDGAYPRSSLAEERLRESGLRMDDHPSKCFNRVVGKASWGDRSEEAGRRCGVWAGAENPINFVSVPRRGAVRGNKAVIDPTLVTRRTLEVRDLKT